MNDADIFQTLSSEKRLQILGWLKDPVAHFPPQRDGDLITDGVCGNFIAEKLRISPSTLSEHMRLLVQAGLVESKRIKQWTFYRRAEAQIAALSARLLQHL